MRRHYRVALVQTFEMLMFKSSLCPLKKLKGSWTQNLYFIIHYLRQVHLRAVKTAPHAVVTSNHKIILLLLRNCNFATVMNHNISI